MSRPPVDVNGGAAGRKRRGVRSSGEEQLFHVREPDADISVSVSPCVSLCPRVSYCVLLCQCRGVIVSDQSRVPN